MMAHCKYRIMDSCEKYDRPCDFSKECFEPEEERKQTNADRIRGMSDEELEIFLKENDFCCEYNCPARIDGCFGNCDKTIIGWLQKEVE